MQVYRRGFDRQLVYLLRTGCGDLLSVPINFNSLYDNGDLLEPYDGFTSCLS